MNDKRLADRHASPPSMRGSFVFFAALSFSQCQQAGAQQATPTPVVVAPPPRQDNPYIEGETCTSSTDCPRSARCIDARCQLASRSLQGEVLAERGARALAIGRYPESVEAYRAAERAFQERSVPIPASVSCGLARALIAVTDRGTPVSDAREAAARALTTCLANAPRGSAMADQALAGLASLAERGLEVAALDRPGATLMTGRDPRPTSENTTVRMVFTGQGEGTRATFREFVQGEPLRREVVRCFLQWWEVARQSGDQGTIRVTYTRSTDDYDDLLPPRLSVLPADIAISQPDAGENLHWLVCAAAAVQTAAAGIRWPGRTDRWSESLVITVGSN